MKSIVNTKGFSLIELMIALALVVIIASAGLPSLTGQKERNDETTFIHSFEKSLKLARVEAITRKETIGLYPNNLSWANGWEIRTISAPVEVIYTTGNTVNNLILSSDDYDNTTPVTFSVQGAVVSSGSFKITKGTCEIAVLDINIAGQLSTTTAVCN